MYQRETQKIVTFLIFRFFMTHKIDFWHFRKFDLFTIFDTFLAKLAILKEKWLFSCVITLFSLNWAFIGKLIFFHLFFSFFAIFRKFDLLRFFYHFLVKLAIFCKLDILATLDTFQSGHFPEIWLFHDFQIKKQLSFKIKQCLKQNHCQINFDTLSVRRNTRCPWYR